MFAYAQRMCSSLILQISCLVYCTVIIESDENQKYRFYDNIDPENCPTSVIIKGFRIVQSKGHDLEDYIDPESGLLDRLCSHRIIGNSEINLLKKIAPYQLRNGELLRRIEINMDSISKQFIKALCEDEQDHIAKFIVTAGCETDSDERLLPRELRKGTDDNMFCLEKLIDTEKRDLLHHLVRAKCITARHRDRVIHSKPEDKAYELLIILQRRRYKDFFNFIECLRKTMQRNIVKILENGGVTEIKIKLLQERGDKMNIEAELINKLTGYVDDDNESELSGEQRKLINELLAELEKEGIYFIGTVSYNTTSNRGFSMFFQSDRDDTIPVFKGSLKDSLEKLFRFLLKIPDSCPPLVKKVTTGMHSNKHHVTAETEQISGKYRRIKFYQSK